MTYALITIVIIFGIIIFASLFVLNFINRLSFYKNKVVDKFSSVNELLEDRINIMDNLINYLESNCKHEDNIIMNITDTKDKLKNVNNINNTIDLIQKSKKELDDVKNLSSNYSNLDKDKEYINFMKDIDDNNGSIDFTLSIYNDAVLEYEKYKEGKFIRVLSKLFNYPNYNYYK